MAIAVADRVDIWRNGFDTDAAGSVARIPLSDGFALWFKLESDYCFSGLTADVSSLSTTTLTVARIVRYAEGSGYVWKDIGEFTLSGSETVLALKEQYCGYQLRFTFASASEVSLQGMSLIYSANATEEHHESMKRNAIVPSTPSTDGCTVGIYFPDDTGTQTGCGGSQFGGYCASDGNCGCRSDHDCFVTPGRPYCNIDAGKTEGTCDKCKYQGDLSTTPDQRHFWCRGRFPSDFWLNQNIPASQQSLWGAAFPFSGEAVAAHFVAPLAPTTNSFFREACDYNSQSDGACVSCYNAIGGSPSYSALYNSPAYATNPVYSTNLQSKGAFGTYHCDLIRPDLPICSSTDYFQLVGIPLTATVNLRGANLSPQWSGASGGEGADTLVNYKGACVPCSMDLAGGSNYVPLHELCSVALPTQPICAATGGCVACTDNIDCDQTLTCDADHTCKWPQTTTASTTANCQKDGSCFKCTKDADCGSTDGGSTANQAACNVATGQCESPFVCNSNAACITKDSTKPNCGKDGKCYTCVGAAASVCGSASTADGPPTGFSSPDAQNQPVCVTDSTSSLLGQCVFCDSNSACGTAGLGANCQSNGQCVDCTSSTCGQTANDGNSDGPPGNPTYTPTGQTTCDTQTKLCVAPFSCTVNNDCLSAGNTGGGKNCQSNNLCVNCVVSKTSTTCSSSDGGSPAGQPNCDQASRLCVDACASNVDCTGTQGANCMANGVCFNCVDNSECATGNAWNGDMGGQLTCNTNTGICFDCNAGNSGSKQQGDCSAGLNCFANGLCKACASSSDCAGSADGGQFPGQTICDTSSGLCVSPCTSNNDCPNGFPNCDKDGFCRSCNSNGYPGCSTNDGPPPAGTNTVCGSDGTCIDPYDCTKHGGDQGGCPANQNCQKSGACIPCDSTVAGAGCGSLDGGAAEDQPTCDTTTKLCAPCDGNFGSGTAAACGATAPNCNKDGSCISCSTDSTCGISDGGRVTDQPHCDTQTHICVNYCTTDLQCRTVDSCNPYCAVDRGCCVECTANSHCPHTDTSYGGLAWRATEATRTVCQTETYQCIHPVPTVACTLDSQCTGSLKACSPSQGVCVQCLFNSHCQSLTDTPICDVAAQQCVAQSAAGVVQFSLLVLLASVLALVF